MGGVPGGGKLEVWEEDKMRYPVEVLAGSLLRYRAQPSKVAPHSWPWLRPAARTTTWKRLPQEGKLTSGRKINEVWLVGEKEAGKEEILGVLPGRGKRKQWGNRNEMSQASHPLVIIKIKAFLVAIGIFCFQIQIVFQMTAWGGVTHFLCQ